MRLLSRIFGGFVLFVALVFGGVSSSFAAPKGDNCYYSDASGKFCFETVEQWLDYLLNEVQCDPPAGYIDSDGKAKCCPTANYIYANTTTGFCECKTEYGMVFNPEIPGCACPTGTEWFDNIGEPGCCANIVEDKCCYYYFFDKQNEETLCYSFTEWIKLVEKIGGAGYIDNKGDPQGCPAGTSPNTQTGFCELTCAEGEYVPAGDYVCRSCPAGYDCPGGTFNIIDYGNNQGVGDPIIYTITLNNYNNTATHQTIYEKYATGWYSNSGATTSISTATVPSRTGYTFRGFYTSQQTDATSSGNTGTQRITKTGGLPSNTTFAANTTLYAAWAKNCENSSNCTLTVANNGAVTYTTSCPNGYVSGEGTYNPVCQSSSGNSNCYRIDLNNTANGGSGGAPTSVYLYRDATTYLNSQNQSKWCKLYTDSACTTEVANNGALYTIPTPTTKPTKPHATFFHYVGSNGYLQPFRRSYINNNPSYTQAWDGCIYPDDAYEGIISLGFNASQTPSLTFNAVYSCDEGWRGNCTTLSGDANNGYYCYSNTACTASPTSIISFNANAGSGGRSGTVTATYGSIVPVITTSNWTTPHRFGYNFQGYADAQSGGNLYYNNAGDPNTMWNKTTNATLYARWYRFMDNTVGKLNFYDGNTYKHQIECSRSNCTLPTYSTAHFTPPTGATWLGWAFLCGNYEYCGAGDATDTGLYAAGTNVTASNVVNNFFGRWNEANNDDGPFYGGLYACWQFNITYNLNGGTNPSGAPTTYNNCLNTTLPTPTRENYVFGGWYDNSSFSGSPVTTIAGGSTGAKTYYAKWTESSCWHTALDNTTYGGTGGTTDIYINRSTCNVYSTSNCSGTALTTLPSYPTKTNSVYSGHFTTTIEAPLVHNSLYPTDDFYPLKDQCQNNRFYNTLVAKYSCNDGYHAASSAANAACVANTYYVHFNDNCPTTASGTTGNSENIQSFTYGTAQNLTNNGFSCTGYTFAGWATSSTGSVAYSNGQSVNNLTTTNGGTFELYAKWSADNVTCSAGQYLPANSTTCETCPVGFYCPSAGTYTISGAPQGRTPCPTGYDDGTTTGKTLASQCQISCGKGERVATANAQCSTPSGGWFSTDTTLTNYGEVSPVTYCMKGYANSGTNPSNHDTVKDCQFSMPAGYKVESNAFAHAAAIRITSASTPLRIVEIQAINTNDVNKLAGVAGSGSGLSNPARATDNDFTPTSYTTIAAGQVGLWVINGQDNVLKSLQIALAPGRYDNVTIEIDDGTNTNWVTVFSGDIEQSQQVIITNHGESIFLTNPATTCPAGQFSTTSTVQLGDTSTCTNVNAGYYTSGGGTSATPTAAGNGCLSGKTCGKCPTGWPHSVAGSNEITDCYSDTKSRAWSGTQVACTNPDTTGCSAVTCASCSNPACNYVAYVNAAGNADGTIKSGCATNNASCQQTVESLIPNTGYHTTSGNLESCPANTYTVTLNKNNGTGGTSSVTATYDADMPTTNVTMPTRTGYTFAGYYDTNASTGGKQYYTAKGTSARAWDKTTENPVLYARWAPNMYTVTLSKNTTDTGATDGTSYVTALYGQPMPTSNPNLLLADTTIVTDKGCKKANGEYPYSAGGTGEFYNVFFRVQPGTWYRYTATTPGTRQGIYEFDSIIDPSTYTTTNTITPTTIKAGGSSGLTSDRFKTGDNAKMVMLYLGNDGVAPTGLRIFPEDRPVTATLTAPVRPNYSLTGYYDATSNGTKYYNYTGGSLRSARTWNKTSDTTLYAQWSQNTVTINLDTNNNGGSGSCDASVTCDAGASCALPQWNSSTCNITNGSKIFVGWATTNDATSETFNITAPSSGTTTYYAVWKSPTCSVTNGSGAIQNTTTNEPKCQATCNTGYHTSGTYSGNAGETTVEYECTQTIYTVNYNLANGYMPVDYIVSDGTNYIQTDVYNDLNKDFMIQGNLYRNSESGLKRVFSNYDSLPVLAMQIQNDGKVKAFIGPASGSVITSTTALALNSPVPYTLTYDKTQRSATFSLDGGTSSISNIPAYSNASAEPLRFFLDYGDPTPIARPVVAADTSITQDNILVANFIPARKNSTSCGLFDTVRSKFYTNTQEMNPFTCPDQISTLPVSYTYGVGATISGTPLREGYTFTGWTGANGNTAQTTVTIGTTASGNKTYTANWAPNTYTISYDLDGGAWGSTPHVETYNIETATFAVGNPTKLGYTFNGWTIITAPTAWGTGSSSDGAINFNIGSGTYGNIVMKANWTINTYTVTVSAGNGVSTVSGTGWTNTGTASMSKTYNYGATIDLSSVVTPTNKAGYYGTTYTVSGSGSLSNGTFIVDAGNATITVNAEGITAPTAENVTLASNITTGTYRYSSPTLTGTVANASTDYDSGISLYYKLGYVAVSSASAECPSSGYDYTDTPSAGTNNAITLENDAFLAYRCYKVQVYATDGVLTSTTTDSSNAVNVSLIQRRLKFNGNEGTVNGGTSKNGYARYGTDLLKAGYVSATDLNPYTAVREGYTFDGWWTAATGGSQVYDANLNLTSATISGYTSGGNLVLIANKNLYAHWTQNTCAPGLYMNNGACVACPENHYCVGGTTTAQACPANLYTPNNTIAAYHDEAGDCGRKLHIGTDVLWLRSDKKSMNSANKALNFDFFNNDGVADLFLNLSTNPSPMSSTKNFKMNVGGTVYYGCDDGTCN